ncbi:MAG: CBS domain-containing protein [Thermodesulfobacteriota bacterium]
MTAEKQSIIRARDVMKKELVYIDGMATAKEAAAKMRTEKVSILLVSKRHDDDAWGVVVIQDFIKGVIVPGRSPSDVNVYEIMTKPVVCVPADMDIRYVARLIDHANIRQAPVEEHGKLVGIISLSSLILDYELF